jgi:tetratricopeptide (TPR) repeat protein
MREYQPWDDSWSAQLVYLLISYEVNAPVEMTANFSYPIFLGAFEKKLSGEDFWQAVAGSMVYVLGHQPNHKDRESYIYWLNTYNPNISKEIIYDGVEQATEGNLEKSIWLFQAAVLLDSSRAEAHFNLGLAYQQMGLALDEKNSKKEAESCFRQAVSYLENAVELDEQFSLAYYNLGFVYKHLGLQDECDKYMEKGILLGMEKLASTSLKTHKNVATERE